jgi:hypothetical protein
MSTYEDWKFTFHFDHNRYCHWAKNFALNPDFEKAIHVYSQIHQVNRDFSLFSSENYIISEENRIGYIPFCT